jgi:transcriptional regulator with XRE-family HTH domain
MVSLKVSVGSRIREIRIENNYTQAHLAEIAGMSPDFISRVERGKSIPSLERIALIAGSMGCHLRDFFDSRLF